MAERFVRGDEVRGFAFPISKGREGYWPRRNADAIRRTSIINILCTIPGERVMEPEFGSNLIFLMFEPNDEFLQQAIIDETQGALQRWDPFIDVVGVAPEVEDDQIKLFIDYIDLRGKDRSTKRIVVGLRRS